LLEENGIIFFISVDVVQKWTVGRVMPGTKN